MKAKYIIGGVTATAIIGMAGANLYADKKLKNFYQLSHHSAIKLKVNEFNMGLRSGTAKSTISVILDPCQPNQKMDFEITDRIERNLFGYTIHSHVSYPFELEQNFKKIMGNNHPFTITTKIHWSGNADFHVNSPVIEHKYQDYFFQSKGMDVRFNVEPKDYKNLLNFTIDLPALTIGDQYSYFALDKFKFNADQFHFAKTTPNAKTELSTNLIRVKSYRAQQTLDLNLEDIHATSQAQLVNKTIHVKNTFNIGKIGLADASNIGQLKLNFEMKDLDADKFQNFYQVMDKNSTECNPNANQEILQALFDVIGQGLKIESKQNVLSFNGSELTANLEATLAKGKYDNFEIFVAALPMQLTAQGRIETSRQFIHEILKLSPENAQFNSQAQVESIINHLTMQGMLKSEGDQLVSRFEYKFGEPYFSNY